MMHTFIVIIGIAVFFFVSGYGLVAVVRDHEEQDKPVVHHFSLKEFGTGNGDDRSGWICACGTFGFDNRSMRKHGDDVIEAQKANSRMQGGGHDD